MNKCHLQSFRKTTHHLNRLFFIDNVKLVKMEIIVNKISISPFCSNDKTRALCAILPHFQLRPVTKPCEITITFTTISNGLNNS